MHQLRNLINRKNIPSEPKKGVNAYEEFLEVVGVAHVVAATMEMLQMEDMEADPLDVDPTSMVQLEKETVLHEYARQVVDKYVNLELLDSPSSASTDGILDYAKEVLSLALVYAEYNDAIREADGDRLIRSWKFLLLLFKASNRSNYSLDALNLLAQYYILLPPRLAQQLAWSRCVNTTGTEGGNIPMDLHMEHLNRACKTAVANLGANATPNAIVRIGKCIGPLSSLCSSYDRSTSVRPQSAAHSDAQFEDDLKKLVSELSDRSTVFKPTPGRKHSSFPTFSGSLVDTLDKEELLAWMQGHLDELRPPYCS